MDAQVREQVFAHLPWWALVRKRHCPHVDVMGVYGVRVGRTRGRRRMWCRRCRRLLDGPVELSEDRRELVMRYHGAKSTT